MAIRVEIAGAFLEAAEFLDDVSAKIQGNGDNLPIQVLRLLVSVPPWVMSYFCIEMHHTLSNTNTEV